jgi:hypothetical protein
VKKKNFYFHLVPVLGMGPEVLQKDIRRNVRVPHLLHPEGWAQHRCARRTGHDTPRTVEIFRPIHHYGSVPDAV